MKYTLKQVMAFSAMTYEKEISRAHGRNGYLIAQNGQRVDQLKRKPLSFLPVALTFSSGFYLVGSNIAALASNGYNIGNILAVIMAGLMSAFAVVLFRRDQMAFKFFKKTMRNYALGHEPEGLWNFEYAQGSGEKGEMIRGILGARMIFRKMIASTSIPMDNDSIDARVTHLVKEITNSPEGEIHEVISEEVGFLCRQAVTQLNFYAPLISFQDEVEKEFMQNHQR